VEEIADAADVAVRTFFRYFQSKQHVLFGDVAHGVAGRLDAALRGRPADEPPVIAVGAALRALDLDHPDEARQVLHRLRLVDRLPELGGTYHLLFQRLHEVIAGFVADRTGRPALDLYPQLVAAAATGSVKAALAVFEATGGARPLDELRDDAYRALTAGLTD
jgi:AcrR family transcriptional regulator